MDVLHGAGAGLTRLVEDVHREVSRTRVLSNRVASSSKIQRDTERYMRRKI